jgi:hypothetical protein
VQVPERPGFHRRSVEGGAVGVPGWASEEEVGPRLVRGATRVTSRRRDEPRLSSALTLFWVVFTPWDYKTIHTFTLGSS